MKIILQNKDNLRFTNIYLFKNGKCIQILDNISYQKTVEQILRIDQTIEYAIVHLPRTANRIVIVNSLNNKERGFKFYWQNFFSPGFDQISIIIKEDGNHINHVKKVSETEAEIMNTMLNEIESKTEEQ